MGRMMSPLQVVALSLALSAAAGCGKKDCVGPGGVSVKDGADVLAADGCNQCFCHDGELSCTIMRCIEKPAAE